jgi:hypothetical protein
MKIGLPVLLGVAGAGLLAGCSSKNTCTTTGDADGGLAALCEHPSAEGGSSSGSSGGGSGGGSGSSGSGSGSGGSSGSGSGGGSGGSSSGSSSGSSGGGENCQVAQGDFCLCDAPSSQLPSNSTPCSPATLQDPGTCCAEPGWPSTGDCICSAFLCYVNSGGGKDCFYQDLGSNGAEVPTTSASGTACCVWGADSSGWICSCYDDATLCEGKQSVSSCTMGTVPPCSSDVTVGYAQVSSCR